MQMKTCRHQRSFPLGPQKTSLVSEPLQNVATHLKTHLTQWC